MTAAALSERVHECSESRAPPPEGANFWGPVCYVPVAARPSGEPLPVDMPSSLHDLPRSNHPKQILAHCPASTAGFPITVMPIPERAEFFDDHHATACIFVAHQGHGRRWYRQGRVTRQLHTAPRMVEIYEQGLVFDHQRWEGGLGRCVRIEFHATDVQRMTHGELPSLTLRTAHEVFDERVSRLTLELAEETLCGAPNGELYVQGLCVALLGVLAKRFDAGHESGAQPSGRRCSPACSIRTTRRSRISRR